MATHAETENTDPVITEPWWTTTYAEFQERWEKESRKERARYDSVPFATLIEDIRARRFGDYYQIWYSLSARAKLQDIGWLLFDILQSNEDYLIRYHCASALISIAGLYSEGFRPEKLSAIAKYPVDRYLEEVRKILLRTLGNKPLPFDGADAS